VKGAVIDTLQAAREDYDAAVKLTRDLVRTPSRHHTVGSCQPAEQAAGLGVSMRRGRDEKSTASPRGSADRPEPGCDSS
jgi:hypothetical protein